MLRGALAAPGFAGIYHVAAAGETSWHGYARFVLDCAAKPAGRSRPPDSVEPCATAAAFPTPAQRPHNSRWTPPNFATLSA
jgi:dTDP-4-dehydrorhamnose reductase